MTLVWKEDGKIFFPRGGLRKPKMMRAEQHADTLIFVRRRLARAAEIFAKIRNALKLYSRELLRQVF